MTKILREYDSPIINVEHTEYGLRLIALREIDEERTHVRVTNQLFPHGFVIPMSTEMTITQWHVPVDDENCYWYAIFTSYATPVDKKKMRDQRLELYELPDYKSRKNKSRTITASIRTSRRPRPIPAWAPTSTCTTSGRWNRWARSRTAPTNISAQSDKAIVQYRRLLRQEIEKVAGGEKPLHVPRRSACAQHPGPGHHGRHRADPGLGNLLDGSRRQAAPRRALGRAGAERDRRKIRHLSAAE